MARFSASRSIKRVRSFASLWRYRHDFGDMLRKMFNGGYRASFRTYVALVAGILYILMPFDVLPDFIPVIGWIDDGTVVYLIVRQLINEVNRYLMQRSPLKLISRKM